jgi:hypothetical protein
MERFVGNVDKNLQYRRQRDILKFNQRIKMFPLYLELLDGKNCDIKWEVVESSHGDIVHR